MILFIIKNLNIFSKSIVSFLLLGIDMTPEYLIVEKRKSLESILHRKLVINYITLYNFHLE